MFSPSKQSILDLRDVQFSYPHTAHSVSDLCFSISEGEFIGLVGANGSGKSTVLKLACGILGPDSGSVMLWNRPLRDYNHKDRAKLVSYLPQSLDASVPFSVLELVSMGAYPYDIPPLMSVDEALLTAGLEQKSGAHLADLSGGELRRAFIAMTLVQGAGLLLLDEPLANLDIRYQLDLIKLLRRLRKEKNLAVLMAIHDISIAYHFEKVLLLKEGRILGFGKPVDLLSGKMIKEAFDVEIEINPAGDKGMFISYGDGFAPESADASGTDIVHSSKFFQNRRCEYFPCHKISADTLNCLFCFCPLYYALCPGKPRYIDVNGSQVKDCSECDYPHRPENFGALLEALKQALKGEETV